MSNIRRLNSQKGMTLVEIIIVVSILAGLMAFLVGQLSKGQGKAKYNQTKLAMGQVGRALEMYYTDCSKFPTELDGLLKKDDCSNWGPEAYIAKSKDLNDSWGKRFEYSVTGSSYELRSFGADGAEGGEGFDADLSSAEE